MEITKTQIELKAFGQDYKLCPPPARSVAEFKKELTLAGEDDVLLVEIASRFLEKCGLPKDVCEQLELDHMHKLIELVSAKKK
jgi:hypothetical protein